jgi:hypothetical protein
MNRDDIHTCHPECQRPICVAVREAVAAEREACAQIAHNTYEEFGVDAQGVDFVKQRKHMKDYSDQETQRNILIDYLQVMIARTDWHVVADVAMDLREMEAERRTMWGEWTEVKP